MSSLYKNLKYKYEQSRWIRFWMQILAIIYLLAIFASIIAPYSAQYENRQFSYAPPSSIHIWDNGISRPFVYELKPELDEYRRQIYIEDQNTKYPIKFFIHKKLFGIESKQPFYLLGADSRGRDIFSRIMYGARISLSIGIFGTLITFFIGTFLGCVAGYFGGVIESSLMRFCELLMLIPSIYLLFALRAIFPPEISSDKMYLIIVVILSLIGWAGLARVIRGMVISLKKKEFVLAAQILGQSNFKIIFRHILPHLSSYLIVSAMFSIPLYTLGESVLSFLGLGIQDPSVSWGYMLSEASDIAHLTFHPWILFPTIFLVMTILSFNIIADFLRDTLDPHHK